MSSTKVVDEQGNEFFDGAIRNVTQIKAANEALALKNKELIKLNQELDRFVYSTSHDLRAPLVSVLGLINVMKISQSEKEKGQYLNLMEVSIKKLENFIEDIINYSQNSRREVEVEEVDLKGLALQVFDHLQFLPNSNKVDFRVICRGNYAFVSDKVRLGIILNNLISNAINYADLLKDQPQIRVEIHYGKTDTYFCVKANGVGIA